MPQPAAPAESPPPLGSWPRTYAIAAVLAIVVMVLLWWLTATWNQPLGSAR